MRLHRLITHKLELMIYLCWLSTVDVGNAQPMGFHTLQGTRYL